MINILKKKLNNLKESRSKTKTEKFQLLLKLVKKVQLEILLINNFETFYYSYDNLSNNDINKIKTLNEIKNNYSQFLKYHKSLISFFEIEINLYRNTNFGEQINIILEVLKSKDVEGLFYTLDYSTTILKKFDLLRKNLEIVEKKLHNLEELDISFFENLK